MRTGYFAIVGFTLSFLFVLAIVALAFGLVSGMHDVPRLSCMRLEITSLRHLPRLTQEQAEVTSFV